MPLPLHLQLKAAADAMEEQERVLASSAQQAHHALELAKLQAQHAREADALHKRLQVGTGSSPLLGQPASTPLSIKARRNRPLTTLQPLAPGTFAHSPPPLQANFYDHILSSERELDKQVGSKCPTHAHLRCSSFSARWALTDPASLQMVRR